MVPGTYSAHRWPLSCMAALSSRRAAAGTTPCRCQQPPVVARMMAEWSKRTSDYWAAVGVAFVPCGMATELRHSWTFSFFRKTPQNRMEPYEKQMKVLATVNTVEDFWSVYTHITAATDLRDSVDIHLFREGIRPMWEDQANCEGGKWMLRLKKGLAARYWEELLLAIIGEQFDVGDEICGCVLSCRFSEDIISVWNRHSTDRNARLHIRDTARQILDLPANTTFEYKPHVDALKDMSSFRGAQSDRVAASQSADELVSMQT